MTKVNRVLPTSLNHLSLVERTGTAEVVTVIGSLAAVIFAGIFAGEK